MSALDDPRSPVRRASGALAPISECEPGEHIFVWHANIGWYERVVLQNQEHEFVVRVRGPGLATAAAKKAIQDRLGGSDHGVIFEVR